jgi:hypothetical protein
MKGLLTMSKAERDGLRVIEAVVISKRRWRQSNRRIDDAERERELGLVRQHYEDSGPTLAPEYLAGHQAYEHSTETLRQWNDGSWDVAGEAPAQEAVFQLRERRSREGELVQIDGSPHYWF